VLLLAHEQIGDAFAALVRHFFQNIPDFTAIVGVQPDEDLAAVRARIDAALAALPPHSGVLALADIFGATPFNAAHISVSPDFVLVSGLNVPMAVKAVQYAPLAENLADLAEAVRAAGVKGIIEAEPAVQG
ncbi:MAG: PTS mannose transporter subunit IIA, partial [Neisseria sp.]|nr:PTS mannose transporter subunit IIA [Neisseria sp.]